MARKKAGGGSQKSSSNIVRKLSVEQLRQISGGVKKEGGGKGWSCWSGSRVYGCDGMASDG